MINRPGPPPSPTSDPAAARRAAIGPVVVALLGVLAIAGYIYWQCMNSPPPVDLPRVGHLLQSTPPQEQEAVMYPRGSLTDELVTARGPDELLLLHEGDRVLTQEPAGLPPFPGAERTSGFARQVGDFVEQVANWTAPNADPSLVLDHYREAAERAGFAVLKTGRPSPPTRSRGRDVRSLVMVRQPPADAAPPRSPRVLIVRVSRPIQTAAATDDGPAAPVRIMVWLRYAMAAPQPK